MAREYKPNPNTSALAARGDLYVELCLKEKPLARAVSVVDEFRKDYCIKELVR